MNKIPTIFNRNPENRRELLDEPHPNCGWVFAGEGVATRKYDGTCVLIQDGKYYKRREVKKGKSAPFDFVEIGYDINTGKRMGWLPVTQEDRWHMEAFKEDLIDGTYELVGPKIQKNPEDYEHYTLVRHAEAETYEDVPRTYNGIIKFLFDKDIEGIVFHHSDGRMAKIKKRDFGQKR